MPAITFDIWHTLVQLSPAAEDTYLTRQEATLADIVASAPRARTDAPAFAPVRPLEAAKAAFVAATDGGGRGSPVVDLAREAARRAGREPAPDRWVAAIERLTEAQPFEQVPGARDQLRALAETGFRIGVVSNLVGETGRSMRRVLARLGLAEFIESWALSEELPWAKPAPEIFWRALEPLGCPPHDAVHIGDLASDIRGARAAHFREAVHFVGARDYGPLYARLCRVDAAIEPPPSRTLAAWADLPALVDSIFRSTPVG